VSWWIIWFFIIIVLWISVSFYWVIDFFCRLLFLLLDDWFSGTLLGFIGFLVDYWFVIGLLFFFVDYWAFICFCCGLLVVYLIIVFLYIICFVLDYYFFLWTMWCLFVFFLWFIVCFFSLDYCFFCRRFAFYWVIIVFGGLSSCHVFVFFLLRSIVA